MGFNIIRRGLYRPKGNLNDSEVSGLIYVLGENDEMPNFFDIKNRTEPIHEDDLTHNYVYYGPGKKPSKTEINNKKFIGKNLGDFNDITIRVDDDDYDGQDEVEITINKEKSDSNHVCDENVKPSQEQIESEVIEKIKSKALLPNPKKQTIIFDINYDIKTIKEICNFLDINPSLALNQLVDWSTIEYAVPITTEEIVDEAEEPIPDDANQKLIDALDEIARLRENINP